MGCSSCSQRYVRRRTTAVPVTTPQPARVAPVMRDPRIGRRHNMVAPVESRTPVVQEEPKEASIVPRPEYAIEPATGQSLSVIKTGTCPENNIPDTTAQPTTFEIESPDEEKTEKKEEA